MWGVISIFFSIVCVLLAVAFFTLFERKILGYIALRKGPNKVRVIGLFLPFADAIKLFTKEFNIPIKANFLVFIGSPAMNFFFILLLWVVFPMYYSGQFFFLRVVFFLCISRIAVYALLGAGWASNSKYTLLGALRGVAQTISYEVRIVFIILFSVIVYVCFDFFSILWSSIWVCFLFFPLRLIWGLTCLAETNRRPLDFAEGESELVSGFNIEYRGGGYILVFLAEYGRILFLRIITRVLFFGGLRWGGAILTEAITFKVLFFSFCFIWVRASFPRLRYDALMDITWKVFLPVSIRTLYLAMILKFSV